MKRLFYLFFLIHLCVPITVNGGGSEEKVEIRLGDAFQLAEKKLVAVGIGSRPFTGAVVFPENISMKKYFDLSKTEWLEIAVNRNGNIEQIRFIGRLKNSKKSYIKSVSTFSIKGGNYSISWVSGN